MDLKKLRELAEAASIGPWSVSVRDTNAVLDANDTPIAGVFVDELVGFARREDAAFVAAANPEVIKALVDEVESLRRPVGVAPELSMGYEGPTLRELAGLEADAEAYRVATGLAKSLGHDSLPDAMLALRDAQNARSAGNEPVFVLRKHDADFDVEVRAATFNKMPPGYYMLYATPAVQRAGQEAVDDPTPKAK